MLRFIHQFASPPIFYRRSTLLLPWLAASTLLLMVFGLYQGLWIAPPDYQQGDSYRIMFIHVPSAWMSLFVYIVMTFSAVIMLIWKIKLAGKFVIASAPVGASFTFLALITGAIWGKPMWGTWWVWDARLTSELILLFIYLGIIALHNAIEDKQLAAKAVGIFVLVGVVNIPIIHFSVEWWSTLHQGPTVSKLDTPSIHLSMLIPLLAMAFAFKLFYFWASILRVQNEILNEEQDKTWLRRLLT